ncbi:hypothetical protein DL96DRAFT_1114919 [Flagelloscypha sp. PMI_526]|nr:hypothetical protein DL96DRAFT_1114919 [Flagelloscypha sp. PMI_526]
MPSPSPLSDSSSSSSPPSSDNVQCPTLQSANTQDVFETVVKGRKSWKLRGGEVVWPPELEAALLEGLENYQPDDSRETRLLGRFPMRNRFISDYIFQKTGKRRTAKQVGSRLQQLRDTCGGKRLLKLLSPINKPPFPAHRRTAVADLPSLCFDSSSETSSEPNTPIEGGGFNSYPRSTPYHSNICIDIIPEDAMYPSEDLTPTEDDPIGNDIVRLSRKPRRLSTIDPTITFISRRPMSARAVFSIHFDDECIHSEAAPLTQRTLPPGDDAPNVDGLLYSCPLAPEFWKTLRSAPDPTRYIISQEVFQQSANATSSTLVYSATYRFSFPEGYTPPQTPAPGLLSPIMSAASDSGMFVMDSSPATPPHLHLSHPAVSPFAAHHSNAQHHVSYGAKQPTYYGLRRGDV